MSGFILIMLKGAEDVVIGEDTVEIFADVHDFQAVQESLSDASIEMDNAELALIPTTKMELEPDKGIKVMGLVDSLEELDDVEKVYTNLTITDEMFEMYASES